MVNSLSRNQPRSHPVKLQGLQKAELGLSGPQPTLLLRLDDDPIAGLLADLLKPSLDAIARTHVTQFSDPWQFYQPIHRAFHLVVVEAICDPYTTPDFQPRLDPQKIESAGLVIRRKITDSKGNKIVEGWRTLTATSTSSTAQIEGWRTLTEAHREQDPDQAQAIGYTPAMVSAKSNALAGRRLTLHPTQVSSLKDAIETAYTERTMPLFVAPPEVCDRHSKTILYGLVPLTSSAVSQSQNAETAFDLDFVTAHLNPFLQSSSKGASSSQAVPTVPLAGQTLNGITAAQRSKDNDDFRSFLSLIRQAAIEFEFNKAEPSSSQLSGDSRKIFDILNKIKLTYGITKRPAGQALFDARSLLDSNSKQSVTLPDKWGSVSPALESELSNTVKRLLDSRLGISNPQLRQFDEQSGVPNHSYHVRAFIRVRRPDDCPPQLEWSDPSEPFTIRPWYDNSPAPPVQVPLPDLLGDRTLLKKLKPNVTFDVPASLFDSIEGMSLQDLLDGKKPASGGLGIGWICGFNIPIITICAFIVLNIFLVLLNFIFGWLPFIKVCVPIPQRTPESGGNP